MPSLAPARRTVTFRHVPDHDGSVIQFTWKTSPSRLICELPGSSIGTTALREAVRETSAPASAVDAVRALVAKGLLVPR